MALRIGRFSIAVLMGSLLLGTLVTAGADGENAGQLRAFSEYGAEPGHMAGPSIIGADSDGSVFVGDQPNAYHLFRIQKFSAEGELEGSVEIPTPNEEVFEGVAVDPDQGRFYVLREREKADHFNTKDLAEEVLVFSTTPDASGELVPPSDGGPSTIAVPQGEESIDDPTELLFDPASKEVVIFGLDHAGQLVLQGLGTDGNAVVGPRFDQSPGQAPGPQSSQDQSAVAIAPDGTFYIVEKGFDGSGYRSKLYRLPADLAGPLTEVPGFFDGQRAVEIQHVPNPGYASLGSQIAISPDGDTLYFKQQTDGSSPSTETPSVFQVTGISLRDRGTSALYGGESIESKCDIQTYTAALAAAGDELYVLDRGPGVEGAPAYGDHVFAFGPGGSGCPAPTAAATLRTAAGEVTRVPPGTAVELDGSGSELGKWGEGFGGATWIIDGPGGRTEEKVAGRLTLDHTFDSPGEYTVRLQAEVKLKKTAPEIEPTVYDAPLLKLVVAEGAAVVRPSVSGLAPAAGPEVGGNKVTIVGFGFEGAQSVKFGGVPATEVTGVDADTVTATAPPGPVGAVVDVSVTTAAGTSRTTAADRYTYESSKPAGPTVTAVSPAGGPAAGGNLVTITGTRLDGAGAVTFGAVAATDVTAVDSGTVVARAPRGAPGTVVDVTVATSAGPTALGPGDRYKYEVLSQQLGVAKVGTGSGTVSSNRAGISCGASCSASFPQAATVVLLASPAAGSTFGGWGGACGGLGPCVVGMTTAKSVTATFEAAAQASAAPRAGGATGKKSGPTDSSKSTRCKAGARPKRRSGKLKCVKKKAGHEKHRRGRTRAKHGHGGKHHSRAH